MAFPSQPPEGTSPVYTVPLVRDPFQTSHLQNHKRKRIVLFEISPPNSLRVAGKPQITNIRIIALGDIIEGHSH